MDIKNPVYIYDVRVREAVRVLQGLSISWATQTATATTTTTSVRAIKQVYYTYYTHAAHYSHVYECTQNT